MPEPTTPNTSPWDVRDDPTGVTVRNARNPLGPALRFTHDQWTDLLQIVAAGRLPGYATETRDGHAIKLAPPGQHDNALYFWLDDMDALTHDILNGRYGPITPPPASAATTESRRRSRSRSSRTDGSVRSA